LSPRADLGGGRTASLLAGTAALLLSACGSGQDETGPGGVTVGEARALEEAAEMLDERRQPAQTPPAKAESKESAVAARER
jgi:hypothetical protein